MTQTPVATIMNPPNKIDIILYTLLLVFFFIVGSILLAVGYTKAGYGSYIVGLVPFIPIFIMEVIRKPKSVQLCNQGLLLMFRLSKPLYVDYDDIVWVTIPKSSTWGNGTLAIKGKFRYRIEYTVCRAIRNAYANKNGYLPKGDPFDK